MVELVRYDLVYGIYFNMHSVLRGFFYSIKFNDLEAIAKDIRGFKDSLYQEVVKRGGVSKLSELTGIPQPFLSRFFNSNSMPRRSTVLAIAKALDLDGLAIDVKWSK